VNEQQQALIRQMETKSAEVQTLLGKASGFTTDDAAKVKSLNAEITTLQEQVELIEQSQKTAAFLGAPANRIPLPGAGGLVSTKDAEVLGHTYAGYDLYEVSDSGKRLATVKSLETVGHGTYGMKTWQAIQQSSYIKAFAEYLRRGDKMSATAFKDLQEGVDPQGGFWAPPQVIARIVTRMATPTRLGGRVTTITANGSSIMMPKNNYFDSNELYSTGFRVTYTGENPGADGTTKVSDDKLFGETKVDIFTAMMSTQIPREFAEDAGVDVLGWVVGKLNETVDLETDYSILFGTGAGRPLGIIPALGTFGVGDSIRIVNSGDANLLTPDGLIALIYSIPEQYINDACASVMNRTNTAMKLRQLKDTAGRYLFGTGYDQSGLADERNPKLVGYDNIFSGFMPNIAANAFPVIFGDWTGYYHAVRLGLSVQVLQEKYAEQGRIGIVARFRHGGRPVEPWKLSAQKIHV
jgi:HK97 family phage major capsid protein